MESENVAYICAECSHINIRPIDFDNPKTCQKCNANSCFLGEQSLTSRWTRKYGKELLMRLRQAWANGVDNWESLYESFPGQQEIANGKDLRFLRDTYQYQIKDRAWAGADLTGAELSKVHFENADLSETQFTRASLTNSVFVNSKFVKTNMQGTDLTGSKFKGGTFLGADLDGAFFNISHDPRYDGTETVTFNTKKISLTWESIRIVGQLPLFGASYFGLVASLFVILSIGRLNETKEILGVDQSIPYPERILLTLTASLFLAIGTTVYKVFCPKEIQEFSQNQWVIQHRQPRLVYFAKRSKAFPAQIIAALFLFFGAGISLYLLLDRIIAAIGYVLE